MYFATPQNLKLGYGPAPDPSHETCQFRKRSTTSLSFVAFDAPTMNFYISVRTGTRKQILTKKAHKKRCEAF